MVPKQIGFHAPDPRAERGQERHSADRGGEAVRHGYRADLSFRSPCRPAGRPAGPGEVRAFLGKAVPGKPLTTLGGVLP